MSERNWERLAGLAVAILGLAAVVVSQTMNFKDNDAADVLGLIGFLLLLLGGCSAL